MLPSYSPTDALQAASSDAVRVYLTADYWDFWK